MAKFITGEHLEKAVYDIIWDAENTLLMVSPFIKLDNYFKKLFDKHINNQNLHLIIVFGKNEGSVSKSLSKTDFDYFKKFLNISIIYVPNLHAKYYGNEHKGVITSINLYDYSFKNNIEFGVYSEQTLFFNNFTSSTDNDAWGECIQIAEKNESVFIKRPVYEKNLLSSILGKKYIKSDILHDITNKFYSNLGLSIKDSTLKKLTDFPDEIFLGSEPSIRPTREDVINIHTKKEELTIQRNGIQNSKVYQTGYCIRTGKQIQFNEKQPMSEDAYQSWAKFSNKDYPEKYCHFSGETSNGETTFSRPILRKNWKKKY